MAHDILIMRDSDGNYHQLPREILEVARVPADRVAELEETFTPEVAGHGGFAASGLVRLDVVGLKLSPGGGGGQHTDTGHADVPHFDFHLDGPF